MKGILLIVDFDLIYLKEFLEILLKVTFCSRYSVNTNNSDPYCLDLHQPYEKEYTDSYHEAKLSPFLSYVLVEICEESSSDHTISQQVKYL